MSKVTGYCEEEGAEEQSSSELIPGFQFSAKLRVLCHFTGLKIVLRREREVKSKYSHILGDLLHPRQRPRNSGDREQPHCCAELI